MNNDEVLSSVEGFLSSANQSWLEISGNLPFDAVFG
jgi:hypothetical protein